MAPDIIAAAAHDSTTGAVVYWTMSGSVDLADLAAAWAAAGLPADWLPKPTSAKDALRRACADLRDDKTLVRKHKDGGWVLVTEQWTPGAAKPTYDVGVRFWVEDGAVKTDGESPHAAAIQAAFTAALATLAPPDLGAWLVRTFSDRLHAALLRETGGVYFVPNAAMKEFRAAKAAVAACAQHVIYEIPAVKSAEAAAAVFGAIQREVAEVIADLEIALTNEAMRGTTLLDRLRTCGEMAAKVAVYERLFGAPCGAAMGQLAAVAVRLRALAAERDQDACDRFAKLEIEMIPALPPLPADPAPAPAAPAPRPAPAPPVRTDPPTAAPLGDQADRFAKVEMD